MAKRQRIVSVTAKQREELDSVLRRPSVAAGLSRGAVHSLHVG